MDFKHFYYGQTLILVNSILAIVSSFWVITFKGGDVTTCKIDRILPLELLYLPIPTRFRNEASRPQFFSQEAFKKNNEYLNFSVAL